MTIIPNFLLKRLYVLGSLKQNEEGVWFSFKNTVGAGTLTRLNRVRINENDFSAEQVWIQVDVHEPQIAASVNEQSPLTVSLNQVITCHIKEITLDTGSHEITLDIISREAGHVVVSIEDKIN
ncbi:MAG: hypothetical protein K2X01_10555 [Cyanobacteria bacterium]|nr:hypothetical protein [Cyanobacteriota bacterium]